MAEEGGNFIAKLIIISYLTIFILTDEYINLEGVLDAMELDGKVCKHLYEYYHDFNTASPVSFLQTPMRR